MTPKQQKFVEEYLIDLNATQAAIRAGYKARRADSIGHENLRKHEIAIAIQEAMQGRSERTQIDADRVLQEYAKIAFLNPKDFYNNDGTIKGVHELSDDVAACIAGIEVVSRTKDNGELETTKKFKISDKLKALQDVGRHINFFEKDKIKLPEIPPALQIVFSDDDE